MPMRLPTHRARVNKLLPKRKDRRPSATARGYGGLWPKVRARQLVRQPLCEVCLEAGRTTLAQDVHHRVPLRQGGDNSPENLESLCHMHHSQKTGRATHRGRSMGRLRPAIQQAGRIVMVCGPPGSGKSTYVAERRQDGDLVLDFDMLCGAISGMSVHSTPDALLQFAWDGWQALLSSLRVRGMAKGTVWVVYATASLDKRRNLAAQMRCEVVTLDVPADECKRRVAERNDPELWAGLIDDWWAEQAGRGK